MAPRRKCTFSCNLQKKFPFIQKGLTDSEVTCTICNSSVSIASSGSKSIQQHIDTNKHKKAVAERSSNKKVTEYSRAIELKSNEKHLALVEGIWTYHSVMHNFSFRSNDCTSKIIKACFENKYSCARTKCGSIATNVFAPLSVELVKEDLRRSHNITVYLDCSNHGSVKLCPVLVRYFLPDRGALVKILKINELEGETSDIILKSLQNTLNMFEITSKIIAFCGDNTNCNFGGAAKKGKNNVFHKMQNFLEKKIIGVNCVAHILNNCIQTATETLPIDIEVIVVKLYSYFYIYTVRVEKFKQICDNVDVEYKKLLGHSKTRWLTLMPALGRIMELFLPLKEYFLKQEKCPTILFNFFNDPFAMSWLFFIHSQASVFHKYILRLESQHISMPEAAIILKEFKSKLIERHDEVFLPLNVQNSISVLHSKGFDIKMFKEKIKSFYRTCISYMNQWDESFKEIEGFAWILLDAIPSWSSVEKSLIKVTEIRNDLNINNNEIFDEFTYVKNYANAEQIEIWKQSALNPDKKWVEIFKFFETKDIPYKNILKLVDFSFALPASNAPTERIFSISNNIWSSEKTQMRLETLESLLTIKCNFEMDCSEFKIFLSNRPNVLKKIHSVEKYQK